MSISKIFYRARILKKEEQRKYITVGPEDTNPDGSWHENTVKLAKDRLEKKLEDQEWIEKLQTFEMGFERPVRLIEYTPQPTLRAKIRYKKLIKESKNPAYLQFGKHY